MCNKLANRHVRVGLADPSDVPRCDICENAPGLLILILFYFIFFKDISVLNFCTDILTYVCSFLLL